MALEPTRNSIWDISVSKSREDTSKAHILGLGLHKIKSGWISWKFLDNFIFTG